MGDIQKEGMEDRKREGGRLRERKVKQEDKRS
jgi:hypothetical protein